MVSGDAKKILALVIVTLSVISIPVLMFFFVIMVYFNVNQIIRFFNTRAVVDAVLAVLLAIFNITLLFALRALIRWVRK